MDCDLSSRKDLPEDNDFTVPFGQVVERDLIQQLSVPSTSINTEISLIPPVIDKKQQFSVTAECIVYMFRKAVRSGYKEILHWYGFAESYDKRINEIRTINKVKINTAKQQVYQEVKKLLPDISDVNLRQQLSRARKLYKLFNAVGMEKIKQVTYSRTPDISKTTHKCDLEQINPFSEGQKISFLRFSCHPEVQF